jgi:hypothetical protein
MKVCAHQRQQRLGIIDRCHAETSTSASIKITQRLTAWAAVVVFIRCSSFIV